MIDENYDEYFRDEMIIKFEDQFRQLATVKGVIRDFVFRVLHEQHSIWWTEDVSPYKVNLWHSPVPEGFTSPNMFLERVMNLCEYEMTHANYGLGFKELMELDFTTFTEIETRVHELARMQADKMKNIDRIELPKQ